MLKERDERCSDRRDLDRRHIHKLELSGRHDREVGVKTGFYTRIDERAVIVDRSVALRDGLPLFDLGGEIYDIVVVEIYNAILDLAVRSLDKTEVVDLGIYA